MKIKKEMQIGEAISKNPGAAEVLSKHGFHCFGCPMSQMETIEEGAKVHGMSADEIEKMVREINTDEKEKKAKGKK